jgi:hypothetical protein
LRAGIAAGLFAVTWYECAGVTRQAMLGLGARIEAHGGADKLLDWAAEVVAGRRQWRQLLPVEGATVVGLAASPPGPDRLLTSSGWIVARAELRAHSLAPGEIPDWVDRLMGRFEGVRTVAVYAEPGGYGGEPCVILFTGSSAYHFEIFLRPSRQRRDLLPWWLGEGTTGLEWRPGILLETGGK